MLLSTATGTGEKEQATQHIAFAEYKFANMPELPR